MRLVNKRNLPDAIFQFLSQDLYDGEKNGNSYSATELLKPPQEVVLTRKHWKDIEVDVSDRLWSLFGQGVHAVLEKEKGTEPIERLWAELDGVKISGKFDRLKDSVLYDFKVTSAFTVMYGSRVEEWKEQLSIYRWLYWKSKGKTLSDKGRIIAILRDWAEKEIKEGNNYPLSPIVEIEIELMSLDETEAMLKAKLKEIQEPVIRKCTDEERWFNKKKQVFNKCARYCVAFKFCEQANPKKVEDTFEPLFEETA